MKRALAIPFIVGTALLMIGADFRSVPVEKPVAELKKVCKGYTIIEAGLGVDCNGDTLKLVKRQGFYELASRHDMSRSSVASNQ